MMTIEKMRETLKMPEVAPDSSADSRLSYEQDRTCPHPYDTTTAPTPVVREMPGYQYGTSPERIFTVDDYYSLPAERRVELIDGAFYDMAAPGYIHQEILAGLSAEFRRMAKDHGHRCMVFPAPCDVQLDNDNFTMVQPDIIVLCDPGRLKKQVYLGAPDLVVEILSPSTRTNDLVLKKFKYKRAGVKEYWIVDPETKQILIYDFNTDDNTRLYGFHDRIPVGISGGKCEIDFSPIGTSAKELERILQENIKPII